MNAIVGIDLGTTYSVLAKLDEIGNPSVVSIDDGRILPSCVASVDKSTLLVGEEAKNQVSTAPENVAQRFKREMGNDKIWRLGTGVEVTPISASAAVLKKLVQEASKELGVIKDVVITVPALFSERARKATIEAGRQAGLNVLNLINEPTASAIAFATKQAINGNVLVYDLGGGTFDVTIAKVQGTDVQVQTSQGDSFLGGVDFDKKIADIIDHKHQKQFGRSLREALGIHSEDDEEDSPEWQNLLQECETYKKTLSKRDAVSIRYRDSPDGPLSTTITASEFNEAISGLVGRTEMLVEEAMEDAGITSDSLDHVLLVGGSTRVPRVRESLEKLTGKKLNESVNPDESVALGAAVYSGLKGDQSRLLPTQREKLSKVKVQDVANHFYGTLAVDYDEDRELEQLLVSVIIEKNHPIPCSKTERYYTRHDGQSVINCRVSQSHEEEPDPQFVEIIMKEDFPLPAGRPALQPIDITFSYDNNQTMDVEFLDVSSGQSLRRTLDINEKVTVTAASIPDFKIE